MGGYSVYIMTVSKTDLKTNRSMKNSDNESAPNMTWKKSNDDGGFILFVRESFVADVAPLISENRRLKHGKHRFMSTVQKYSPPFEL